MLTHAHTLTSTHSHLPHTHFHTHLHTLSRSFLTILTLSPFWFVWCWNFFHRIFWLRRRILSFFCRNFAKLRKRPKSGMIVACRNFCHLNAILFWQSVSSPNIDSNYLFPFAQAVAFKQISLNFFSTRFVNIRMSLKCLNAFKQKVAWQRKVILGGSHGLVLGI